MGISSTYQPISCAMHSELELAIMHGKYLYLQLKQPDFPALFEIKPYDLQCRKSTTDTKAEYLLASDKSGLEIVIRLDNIHSFQVL